MILDVARVWRQGPEIRLPAALERTVRAAYNRDSVALSDVPANLHGAQKPGTEMTGRTCIPGMHAAGA
jgi:hypothetical protein